VTTVGDAASVSSAIYAFSAFSFNWMTGIVRDVAGDYNSALFMMASLILAGAVVSMYLLNSGTWAEPMVGNDVDRMLLDESSQTASEPPRILNTAGNPIVDPNHFVPSN
jgi:hypothetical protein